MNDKHTHFFSVQSATAPVIEIDSSCMGLYVRFKHDKVARTIPSAEKTGIVNLDLNAKGEVVGVEAIGAESMSIAQILHVARVTAPKVDFSGLRFTQVGTPVPQPA